MFGVREKKARTSKKSQGKSGEKENEQKLCHDYILDVHRDRRNQKSFNSDTQNLPKSILTQGKIFRDKDWLTNTLKG